MQDEIPFNKPHIVGNELAHIEESITRGNISGDGYFTKRCSELLEQTYRVPKILLTPSCTASLELAAMLLRLREGDEVLMPAYTFVSTANAFLRMGAKPRFVDIRPDTLNMDETKLEAAITEKTKAICVVHYAGVACAMDEIMAIAETHNLSVVEDAAQGVHASYKGRALGSIGKLGAYSFHATKNYTCGEGGALCVNDPGLVQRAEILREKGTNRTMYYRGEVDKYTWVDVGSSYVLSEISAAFLYGQLEHLAAISERRKSIYDSYLRGCSPLAEKGVLQLPTNPEECKSNYHMFYVLLEDEKTRSSLIEYLKGRRIHATFHYVPLHTAPAGLRLGYKSGDLPVTEEMSRRLLRLPFYYEITDEEQSRVLGAIQQYFGVG